MNSDKFLNQLETGAFILVKHENKHNIMTIGWGGIIRMWDREIMVVPVRTSRYTHELLSQVDEFIVSVPAEGEMLDELSFCGSRSGRNINKVEKCNLTPKGGLIGCTNYKARVVFRQEMKEENLDELFLHNYYPQKNMHVLYYCEVEQFAD